MTQLTLNLLCATFAIGGILVGFLVGVSVERSDR